MGVMACGRYYCESILCDQTILQGRYYICDKCFKELEVARYAWPRDLPPVDIGERIISFMRTEPGSTPGISTLTVEEEFQRLTRY